MKISPSFHLITAASALLLLAGTVPSLLAQATDASANTSFLTNGNFSAATKDSTWPDDWAKPKDGSVTYESEGSTHFIRLKASEPGKMIMLYREVTIPAGVKTIEISIKFRSLGVVHGEQNYFDGRAIFHYLDDTHKQVSGDPKVINMSKSTGEWTTQTVTAPVPDGATKLALMPCLFKAAAGQIDIAEIGVTPK